MAGRPLTPRPSTADAHDAGAVECSRGGGISVMGQDDRPNSFRTLTVVSDRVKLLTPMSVRTVWRSVQRLRACPPEVGRVAFGHLRRTTPFGRKAGFDRGTPIDRVYIERFLRSYIGDIRGTVLEFGECRYTAFGQDRVVRIEVVHYEPITKATLVCDLESDTLPVEYFDCIICTQVLQYVYNLSHAMATMRNALKPNGVLLVTAPGITGRSGGDGERPDMWRFTKESMERLASGAFGPHEVEVHSHGNVLAASAFLYGLCAEDLPHGTIDVDDPTREVTVTLRAVRT